MKSEWIFGKMFFGLTSLFESDGIVMIWRTAHEEFHRKSSISTIKQVAGSVMIWSCFIRQGVGKLYVSSTDFTLEIFCGQPSIDTFTLGQQCIFMYVIMIVNIPQDELKRRRIETLVWPSYSPDFNPNENLWDELERTVKTHQPKTTTELELLLIEEWNKIELPVLEKLVDSLPSRLY